MRKERTSKGEDAEMEIRVIKRDGGIQDFNPAKMAVAFRKAIDECDGKVKFYKEDMKDHFSPEFFENVVERYIVGGGHAEKRTETAMGGKTSAEGCSYTPNEGNALRTQENSVYDISSEELERLVASSVLRSGSLVALDAERKYSELACKRRSLSSRVRVVSEDEMASDVTDMNMLVRSQTGGEVRFWDRERMVERMTDRCGMDREEAESVAKEAEKQIACSGTTMVSTTHIREIVNDILRARGRSPLADRMKSYEVPMEYIDGLMNTKNNENSNIVSNNPEAVNLAVSEYVLKQWGLDTIFSPEVKSAHDTGLVHLHDLGYPHRVYCSSHSIEYIKKYGLKGICNLNTESKPAKTASVLTGHLNTYLASMQANYAGALGIAYINIFYAPYVDGMTDTEMHQVAQELIFNGSQNAFSRGGQTLFLDFNIHSGIPKYLKAIPAIGPGGKYSCIDIGTGKRIILSERKTGSVDKNGNVLKRLVSETGHSWAWEDKDGNGNVSWHADERVRLVTYGDYEETARRFTRQLLKVWKEGDANGRIFEFPKCDFHVSRETFEDEEQHEIFLEACDLASHNGSTYFIFDRDEVTLSACCRLRTTIEDDLMLRHPESMRFCGFQNVTVNIPHCAYQSKETGKEGDELVREFYDRIDYGMDIALNAHLQKRKSIAEMMSAPGRPLWQIGKICCDGRPYVELDKATYIIGLIGVNDAVKFLTGKELHESEEAMRFGVEIVSHMYLRTKEYGKRHGLKFTLEESPAESAARRLAKTDLVIYHDYAKDIVKGGEDSAYYTNSVHLSADADVPLVERIVAQGVFHSIIESGAITHAFIGEEQPDRDAIAGLVREVFFRTQSAQVTFSPEFTFCQDCGYQCRGLLDECPSCGSHNVYGETRVVGYFSKVQNWNKSKRYGELVARQKGKYKVSDAE